MENGLKSLKIQFQIMCKKLKNIYNLISNMGFRYVIFRIIYIIKTKIGWQTIKFPISPKFKIYISLDDWKENLQPFFFYGKEINGLSLIHI